MSTTTVSSSSPNQTRQRKAMHPPVKVACTSCRASRTRCDGKPICNNCLIRGKECKYLKSNRGGPRVSHKKAALEEEKRRKTENSLHQGQSTHSAIDQAPSALAPEDMYDELIASMIMPGAGLIDVENDGNSDDIFDSIFMDRSLDENVFSLSDDGRQCTPYRPLVRKYSDNRSILNAYFIFIHQYFPILPPPEMILEVDDPAADPTEFEPSSPLAMALLAILVLIPHPSDLQPDIDESICLRRQEAHSLAMMAMESIEIENELLESAISPSAALSHDRPSFSRDRFHPSVPVEIESVLAYTVLSIYEYAQRGNLAKMRNRASQAYDAAIRLGLHDISNLPLDPCTEARKRAWWMTYTVVLQSSIVSSAPPIISIDFNQFRTPLPTIRPDADAWAFFIEAQQCILKCTQYTVALKKMLENGSDPDTLRQRRTLLDGDIDSVLFRYSSAPDDMYFSTPSDPEEHMLAKSLRLQALIKLNSARIKLHRYQAFLDIPIFTRRHCDLEQADESIPRPIGCSCHTTSPYTIGPGSTLQPPHNHSESAPTTCATSTSSEEVPFHDMSAARTCLKAALAIGRAFEGMPFPNPMQLALPILPPALLSPTSVTLTPRTMPSFACCAMQSCYTLLTLCFRSQDRQHMSPRSPAADKGLEELYAGVSRVLAALQNYAIAFEALNGMTQQVEEALESLRCVE